MRQRILPLVPSGAGDPFVQPITVGADRNSYCRSSRVQIQIAGHCHPILVARRCPPVTSHAQGTPVSLYYPAFNHLSTNHSLSPFCPVPPAETLSTNRNASPLFVLVFCHVHMPSWIPGSKRTALQPYHPKLNSATASFMTGNCTCVCPGRCPTCGICDDMVVTACGAAEVQ